MHQGMTLLEILTVISVIAVLLAMLVPALHAVHEDDKIATCQNNLRQIAITAGMYSDDNSSGMRGARPTLPWSLASDRVPHSCTISYFSEYIYGGFQAPLQNGDYPDSDVYCISDEYRPFNKYIAPGICGSAVIRQYICPSDTFTVTPLIGTQGIPPKIEERYSSWEVNGNSYPLNWYWLNAPPMNGGEKYWDLPCMSAYGSAMLSKKAGGAASEFIVFMEGAMSAYLYDAQPPDSPTPSPLQMLGVGWHGRLSMYCVAMWDGHAEYRFVDTRYTSGEGYELWPERGTQWPGDCP